MYVIPLSPFKAQVLNQIIIIDKLFLNPNIPFKKKSNLSVLPSAPLPCPIPPPAFLSLILCLELYPKMEKGGRCSGIIKQFFPMNCANLCLLEVLVFLLNCVLPTVNISKS